MKSMKLSFLQQKTDSEVIFNPRDLPDVQVGDVLEIYHPDDEGSRLLVQVQSLKEPAEYLANNAIGISNVVGRKFELRNNKEVSVSVANVQDVALNLVELVFKDQYYSRADMWRMRASLMKQCLHHGQKVELFEMRATVEEMWASSVRVMCGVVTDETRVTFRSSTAQVNIFIQMSSEMWQFDEYGDLIFEKAVDRYLVDLFSLWKEKGCAHDVTITLFSRTFYDAEWLEDFPEDRRDCIQRDYKGRYYEDFYRVVVQNERYEDWIRTINTLKTIFNNYDKYVLHFHEHNGMPLVQNNSADDIPAWNPSAAMGIRGKKSERIEKGIPSGWNSTAAEGNVLEVLNMALNVFEKYFIDRCFERTGKLSIVITPGAGIFDVDRELMNMTKQRTIDCGSSCDLVCMAEQPPHAVPLFRINKDPNRYQNMADDYNVPHWLNLSYYTSKCQMEAREQGKTMLNIDFLQLVEHGKDLMCASDFHRLSDKRTKSLISDEVPFIDYDGHDMQVFKSHVHSDLTEKFSYLPNNCNIYRYNGGHRERVVFTFSPEGLFHELEEIDNKSNISRSLGNYSTYLPNSTYLSHSYSNESLIKIEQRRVQCRRMAGSLTLPFSHHRFPKQPNRQVKRKALVNPFAPSRLHNKITSNRRRWSHAFPTDSSGASIQPHLSSHMLQVSSGPLISPTKEMEFADQLSVRMRRHQQRVQRTSECNSESSCRIPITIGSVTNASSADSLKEVKDHDLFMDVSRSSLPRELNGMFARLPHVGSSSSISSSINNDAMYGSSFGKSNTLSVRQFSRSERKDSTRTPIEREVHSWYWGAATTVEPEWRAEVQTGMDWKSMTIPASLPTTTDYFPDQTTLELFYLVSEYTLVVDDLDLSSSYFLSRRRTPTLKQAYDEMIYQRLAQGFQIIIIPKSNATPRASNLRKGPVQSIEEVILSIGRIFHKLTLYDMTIVVKRYWPRHPYKQLFHRYNYRFQVPDSNNYDVSWTDFKTERLDVYNWNYVDHYLLTQGEENAKLQDSQKYWRSRFFLLPCNNCATKRIFEGLEICNIYEEKEIVEQIQLVEGFLRFLESINKTRREPNLKKATGRRGSVERTTPEIVSSSLVVAVPRPELKKQTPVLSVMDTPSLQSSPLNHTPSKVQDPPAAGQMQLKLHSNHSLLPEIVKAMLDPNVGLNFLKRHQDVLTLPSYTFVSYEAVNWIKKNVEGISSLTEAILYMQHLVDSGFVLHVSGNSASQFNFGFYLYFIATDGYIDEHSFNNTKEICPYFEREYCEVAVEMNIKNKRVHEKSCAFAEDLPREEYYDTSCTSGISDSNKVCGGKQESNQYKVAHLDIKTVDSKTNRPEWGSIEYHRNYNPCAAFEISLEWLVATGSILGDLINLWVRKAALNGFHLLPVPSDPFALPFTPNSDPLRGPIFVPLAIDCIVDDGIEIFHEFPSESRAERLALFQDSIVKSFGFMRDCCPKSNSFSCLSFDQLLQYVHCTGGMFVMILSANPPSTESKQSKTKSIQEQYEAYIARQCVKQNGKPPGNSAVVQHVGFLWAWNFMLTKRWRSPQTGDDLFQDRLFSDFRKFCSNDNDRLKTFWNTSMKQGSSCQDFSSIGSIN